MSINVLDCTLRDGGYYNDWDFSTQLAAHYLQCVHASGIKFVEIGFRFPPKDEFLGAYAYSTDAFLATLPIPDGVTVGVMVNASDLVLHPDGPAAAIGEMFQAVEHSPVQFVRVAAHFRELNDCGPALKMLKELGYLTTINLMQITGQNSETIKSAVQKISEWEAVEILYFADSMGNMEPSMVGEIVDTIRSEWKNEVGIHTHENMGKAVVNSLAAIENGVSWVDGTIYGMGRGAGNARTEFLLIELKKRGLGNYRAEPLFPLVLNEFERLHREYQWGSGLPYYLSGAYNIHPTYVQELLQADENDAEQIIESIRRLRNHNAASYKIENLQEVTLPPTQCYRGSYSAEGWADGGEVLIVAAGPWVKENPDAVVHFIDVAQPKVICLNTTIDLPHDRISVFAACHTFRFATEFEQYMAIDKPLIIPTQALPDGIREDLSSEMILDYGMSVEKDKYAVDDQGCTIPRQLVAAYALAFANAAGASKIFLAGFDGYSQENPMRKEMERVFSLYFEMPNAVPIVAVTPTAYSIPQSTLFSPII